MECFDFTVYTEGSLQTSKQMHHLGRAVLSLRGNVSSHIYDNLEMAVGMEHLKNSYPFIDIC